MSQEKPTKKVPRYRFPEFKKAGEWDFKNGNEVFIPISNKDHNSDLPILAITQELGAVPRDLIDYKISVTDKSIESYKVVEIGDYIISLRSFQGGIEYSNYKGICSPAYIILRKKIPINEIYFKIYFKTNKFIQDMNKDIEGIRDGKMVSYQQFSSLVLPFPSLPEQVRIADCLSSLDELITAEAQKVDTLKDHKKSLMQKLFPQEGEKVQQLRFPEFKKAGEWEEKKLGDVSRPIILRAKLNEKNNILTLSSEYGIISQQDYFGKKIAGENTERYIKIKLDDFVYNDRTTKAFAYGTIKRLSKYEEGIVSPIYKCFRFLDKQNAVFWECYFNSGIQELQIDNLVNEGARTGRFNISIDKLLSISVWVPSGKEQQRIADCLSSLDELITAQAQKVEALKLHKKGLMQGLFPSGEDSIP